MITINTILDMRPGAVPKIIHLSQYDSDFSLVFRLHASFGTLNIESGTTAEIRGTKKSGTGYSASATLNTTNNTVTVAGDAQMTAVAGQNIYEIVLIKNNKVLGSANFILLVERAALDADTITDATVLRNLEAIVEGAETATQAAEDAEDAADRAEAAAQSLVIDQTPTQGSANAVSSGGVYEALQFAGLSDDAKTALLACFEHVAWTNEHGQDYYDALEEALFQQPTPITDIEVTIHYINSFASGAGEYRSDGTYVINSNAKYASANISGIQFHAGDVIGIRDNRYKFALGTDNQASSPSGNYWVKTISIDDYVVITEDIAELKVMMVGRVDGENMSASDISNINSMTAVYKTITNSPLHSLYSLSAPTVFAGRDSDVIDSNIILFGQDRDLTIMLDFSSSESAGGYRNVFYAGDVVSPYNSVTIRKKSNSNNYELCTPKAAEALEINTSTIGTNRIVVRHLKDSGFVCSYYNETYGRNNGETPSSGIVSNANLYIGGARQSGLTNNDFIGTISQFNVYDSYVSDAVVDAFLGGGE